MSIAIIETTGNGRVVVGAWVADADHGTTPDVAFTDETAQLMAEQILGEAAGAIDNDAGLTWAAFMASLWERQNHLTVERVWLDEWAGTPSELLAAAQAALAAGKPLAAVGT